MHLFLTGAVQAGKSTVIRRTLAALGTVPGGYRTYFGPDRFSAGVHSLYLTEASEPPAFDEAHTVARVDPGRSSEFYLDRFEELALEALRNRRGAPLILLDECGWMERDALRFQQRIAELLEGDTPLFGVVRHGHGGSWLELIRQHPAVRLLTVTEENRDELPAEAERLLRPLIFPGKG